MSKRPLTPHARRLRQASNFPERLAWEALRTLRKHGYPVRRQHPIQNYIVDFAITKARLVIEIDGSIHDLEQVHIRDAARDRALVADGWHVLRVKASDALDGDLLLRIVAAKLGLDW